MRHFCIANNLTRPVRDGCTAWQLRQGSEFPGQLLPFGCLVDFKPTTKRIIDGQEKFAPKSVPGLFVGYFMLPGGRWSGDYLVIELKAMAEATNEKYVGIQRIKEIYRDPKTPFVFPMKERYERKTRTIEGIKDDGAVDISTWDLPRETGSSTDVTLPPPVGLREETHADPVSRGETLAEEEKGTVEAPKADADYWKINENKVIRVQVRPRVALFTPVGTNCPIETTQL
ncbi:MAG: hypothetical protein GY768_29810, partial [Planctomycetaceae bacterium]|nr:hypothetical protein [Planctomycetaceae bacterium]